MSFPFSPRDSPNKRKEWLEGRLPVFFPLQRSIMCQALTGSYYFIFLLDHILD